MTAQPKSEFLNIVLRRGFMHQCTDLEALDEAFMKGHVTGYVGFDATADSLHAGSLVSIMLLYWLQYCGHRPLVLMGGGTTKVGDPSGKDESRQLLTADRIEQNIASIKGIFDKVIDFRGDGPDSGIFLNNAEWLDALEYVPFLRDVGRHFTINRMLTMDSVRLRLDREQPLSFLEFNYMLLQAYDFAELNKRYGCTLQMGGSDQWGNITQGIDLGRRMHGASLFGLTTPLITTASGAKMGKTAAGAVWLNPDRLSAYDYYQYWRNVEDADVGRFLRLFTMVRLEEIERLEALKGQEINEAKKVLAREACAIVHGREAAVAAETTALETFEKGASAAGLPTFDVPQGNLDAGVKIIELFVQAGLAKSNGEARRLIRQGGAKVNDTQFKDEHGSLTASDLNGEGVIKLSAGKKRHALIRPA